MQRSSVRCTGSRRISDFVWLTMLLTNCCCHSLSHSLLLSLTPSLSLSLFSLSPLLPLSFSALRVSLAAILQAKHALILLPQIPASCPCLKPPPLCHCSAALSRSSAMRLYCSNFVSIESLPRILTHKTRRVVEQQKDTTRDFLVPSLCQFLCASPSLPNERARALSSIFHFPFSISQFPIPIYISVPFPALALPCLALHFIGLFVRPI